MGRIVMVVRRVNRWGVFKWNFLIFKVVFGNNDERLLFFRIMYLIFIVFIERILKYKVCIFIIIKRIFSI